MWSRANLKANAKIAFKRNYWKCVLVAFILGIAASSGSIGTTFSNNATTIISNETDADMPIDSPSPEAIMNEIFAGDFFTSIIGTTLIVVVVLVFLVIGLTLQFFLFGPLQIGCCNFFKKNAYEKADLNCITFGFSKNDYWKMAITMFLKNLYIALWSLLLIIPGVIKAYEYRMIPYILTDCPDISKKDAFRISKEMMKGNKMDAFILDLSFFGWSLLAAITCGIAGVFYVSPYVAATDAELFIAIREEYFKGQSV